MWPFHQLFFYTLSPRLLLFWTLCGPLHGFQSQDGSLACTLLLHGESKDHNGATSAFSTNRGVHCVSVCTADLPSRRPSCKQRRTGNGKLPTWAAVSEIRSHAVHSTSKSAIHSATPAGAPNWWCSNSGYIVAEWIKLILVWFDGPLLTSCVSNGPNSKGFSKWVWLAGTGTFAQCSVGFWACLKLWCLNK